MEKGPHHSRDEDSQPALAGPLDEKWDRQEAKEELFSRCGDQAYEERVDPGKEVLP